MDEPVWLSRLAVDALHLDLLREHGGLQGIRDENALESALARPRQRRAYDQEADLAALAAAYGFGLVQDHPYADANKRIGFIALATFLEVNGVELKATDGEVVAMMDALAGGRATEEDLATWIRLHF
jgi:death-on-curing protein